MTNSTQFGNDSNYSKFNGENVATNCSRVTVLALDCLTKKHFGHCALLKLFSVKSPRTQAKRDGGLSGSPEGVWEMVSKREVMAHQCQANDGCLPGSKSLTQSQLGIHVHLFVDIMTTVVYLKKMGGGGGGDTSRFFLI